MLFCVISYCRSLYIVFDSIFFCSKKDKGEGWPLIQSFANYLVSISFVISSKDKTDGIFYAVDRKGKMLRKAITSTLGYSCSPFSRFIWRQSSQIRDSWDTAVYNKTQLHFCLRIRRQKCLDQ